MFCQQCGTTNVDAAAFCSKCGTSLAGQADLPPPIRTASVQPTSTPTSAADVIPDGVKGWSWGAFFLNWIWAIGNKTWWGLLALIPYVNIGVAVWLGIKGREMAWKSRHWDDLAHFNRVQRRWSQWGIGVVLVSGLLGVIAAIGLPAMQAYRMRAAEAAAQASTSAPAAASDTTPSANTAPVILQEAQSPPAAESGQGKFDSNDPGLSKSLDTVAGKLVHADNAGTAQMTLNGKPLFSGDDAQWQFPVRLFNLSHGRQAVLMASSGGRGTACETMFFILAVDAASVATTPEFGTCAPQGTYVQAGDRITLTLPMMGGQSTYVFDGKTLTENDKPVPLTADNDPSK